jgi:hypothetical protein
MLCHDSRWCTYSIYCMQMVSQSVQQSAEFMDIKYVFSLRNHRARAALFHRNSLEMVNYKLNYTTLVCVTFHVKPIKVNIAYYYTQ